eukprot:TRINITY_DN9293_c0_g2_i1.p1 TRINITY_DN9293_c0_g2~~TRINITY_DN9293_c0_g2_i1.p1  ORF type:complete len:454 (-),score=117.04 TRINITY_DN9293_c0_g2_i1:601-1962(-)
MTQKTLKFKEIANELRLENIQLRTRVKQLDAEMEKKARLIQVLRAKLKKPNSVSATHAIEASSIISLKKYFKDLKSKLQEKTDSYNKMQAMLNSDATEVLEKHIEHLTAKCKKMKSAIEGVVKKGKVSEKELEGTSEMQKKLKQQNKLVGDLGKKKQQLTIMLKRRQSEIEVLREKIIQLKEKARKYTVNERDYAKNSQRAAIAKKKLEDLKAQLNAHSEPEECNTEEPANENAKLRKEVENKEEEIEELMQHKEQINDEVEQLKEQVEECTICVTCIDEMKLGKRFLVPTVSKEEVKDTIMNFKYALMQLNISPESIREAIFKEFGEEDTISIYELARIVVRIVKASKRQCEKLARFLIEEPKETTEYNKYLEASVVTVVNELRSALGNYSIPQESAKLSIAKVKHTVRIETAKFAEDNTCGNHSEVYRSEGCSWIGGFQCGGDGLYGLCYV